MSTDHKIKTATGKPPLDLIPLPALVGVARAFEHGVAKYEIGNFLRATVKDGAHNRYIGAALRHLMQGQRFDGLHEISREVQINDLESGLPHLDHAIASLIMLRAILTAEGFLPEDPGPSHLARERTASNLVGLAAREGQ